MDEIIVACVLLIIAAGLLVISVFSFREKGVLLNNAYLYASPEEREHMIRKPYYRQTAWVFLCLSVAFLLMGTALLTGWEWLYTGTGVCMAVAVAYAVLSAVRIEKSKKQNEQKK